MEKTFLLPKEEKHRKEHRIKKKPINLLQKRKKRVPAYAVPISTNPSKKKEKVKSLPKAKKDLPGKKKKKKFGWGKKIGGVTA